MQRVKALDGLRGTAVSLVVCNHVFGFAQGWIGVDIFFVLSGFLITTILLAERSDADFWRIFYLRRATRILPPFLCYLSVAALTVHLHPAWLWVFLVLPISNIAIYGHPHVDPLGLAVLWSLSVEEQFYMVWPALVRRLSRRALVIALLCIVALEPLLRVPVGLHVTNWRLTYMLTPFRLDGLALGALLAIAAQHQQSRALLASTSRWLAPLGVVVVIALLPYFSLGSYPLLLNAAGYSIIAFASFFLVAAAVLHTDGWVARIFAWRPLVSLGTISYGLYLYHELIFTAAFRTIGYERLLPHLLLFRTAVIAASLIVATLSYRFMERPILAWGKRRVGSMREERAIAAQAGL